MVQEFNKRCMTIVFPDSGVNPDNPSGVLCREAGCQMVAMRYQFVDTFLEENASFFNSAGYAFSLKPAHLRYSQVTIAPPVKQKPNYSYQTRNIKTNFYEFKY
jgi:hypothetical protein